jgi:hypothetical protein
MEDARGTVVLQLPHRHRKSVVWAQWGLGDGHFLVDSSMARALVGVMLAPTIGPPRATRILSMKISRRIDGGFCTVHMGCSLKVF